MRPSPSASAHAERYVLPVCLGALRRPTGQNLCSERPTRGHPARLARRNPTFCSKPVPLGLLQEWLRTAALAESKRDASSMRARLSLSAQGFRGGGPGRAVTACLGVFTGGSPGHPRWPTRWAESLPHHSALGLSAGGCQVKTASGPPERSLPPGSGALGRGRTGANGDPRVMTLRTRRGMFRARLADQ